MNIRKTLLALQVSLVIGLTGVISRDAEATGFPVFDGGNLIQNVITAIEEIFQTIKQIQEYKTQLNQYEDQIRNTMAPAVWVWDQSQRTMSKMLDTVDQIRYYKETAGNLQSYLDKYQDLSYYRSADCYWEDGCQQEMSRLLKSGSDGVKRANDAMIKGMVQQQEDLLEDARTLEELQSAATDSQGRMEAIQYANQLASKQIQSLLQIRAALLQAQQVEAARVQQENAKESLKQSMDEKAREGKFKPSPKKSFSGTII